MGRLLRSRIRWRGYSARKDVDKNCKKQNNTKEVQKGKATADMEGLHEEGHEKIQELGGENGEWEIWLWEEGTQQFS